MVAVIGNLFGPPLAVLLLEPASWRWIFFINIPVGIVGMFAVLRFVPCLRHVHPAKFDWAGIVLAAITIMSIVSLSETMGTQFLSMKRQIVLAALAIRGGVAFVRRTLTCTTAMLDLRMFSKTTYRASMFGGALMRARLSASPILFLLFFQIGLGWTPVRSGLVMTANIVGFLLAPFAGLSPSGWPGFARRWLQPCSPITRVIPVTFREHSSVTPSVLTRFAGGFLSVRLTS